jgi:hypothetical protein
MEPFNNPSTGSGWLFMNSAWRNKKVGDKCPNVSGYDRMRTPPTSYCGRTLFDLDERIEKLYNDFFKKRISANDPRFAYKDVILIDKGTMEYKSKIRELILGGKKPVCGYVTTSIRGVYDRVIFFES